VYAEWRRKGSSDDVVHARIVCPVGEVKSFRDDLKLLLPSFVTNAGGAECPSGKSTSNVAAKNLIFPSMMKLLSRRAYLVIRRGLQQDRAARTFPNAPLLLRRDHQLLVGFPRE
jgi:hypothetical protein